ncbi:MAG: SDR family oxidoreductase [Azospirillaceae bacterium]
MSVNESAERRPPSLVVLGATSAIAEAVARRHAARGWRLVLAARDEAKLAAVAADATARGAAAVSTHRIDFDDAAAEAGLLDAIEAAVGTPDAVLLAFGTLPDPERAHHDGEAAAAAMTTNFVAPVRLVTALAERMEAAGRGTIAVITSVAGDRGRQSNYVYGAAKGGLQTFLDGLRHRLVGKGVAVVDIRPGFVDTPMTATFDRGGPLWATPARVARDIDRAMERGRAVVYTPWFWRWIMLVIRLVPRFVMHRTGL